MKIIGREKEKAALEQYYNSSDPEFLAVYGRRRIGKTFLIREYFNDRLDFHVTGLASGTKADQLRIWSMAINEAFGGASNLPPTGWRLSRF